MAAKNIRDSSFEVLADELIDIILSYEFLDHCDLCSFAKTCARLKEIANYSELWRKKAFHRWKRWKITSAEHWKDVYRDRHMSEKEILLALDKLSVQCGRKAYASRTQYRDALEYVATEKPYDEYLDCTLEEFFYKNPEIPRNCNLTHQYYAEKMYNYSEKLVLTREWKMLMERPVEEQHLEDGAILIAKWIDIRKTSDRVQESLSLLDKMADRVKSIIQEQVPPQGCSSSRDPQVSMQILEAIKHVMYKEEKFVGNAHDYYNVDNSLIIQVLKTKQGIPITLAVIFVAVARRLGVDIEPVNSRDHFLLRYCSDQNSRNMHPSERYTYIDAFDEGKFYSQEQCANHFFSGIASLMPIESLFPHAPPKNVFIRMATNIARIYHCAETMTNAGLLALRNAYELRTLLEPSVPGLKLLIAQIDVHLDVDLDEAIRILNEILHIGHDVAVTRALLERAQEQKHKEEEEKRKPVKKKLKSDRLNNLVEYSVGMAMRHRRYNYGCVIYGWDHFCAMDELWIIQMGVDQLPLGRSQPFYNVLGNDGSSRYAAQENLFAEPHQPLNPHPEIGKYFKSWTGTRYIPNEYLSQRYPEDYHEDLDEASFRPTWPLSGQMKDELQWLQKEKTQEAKNNRPQYD